MVSKQAREDDSKSTLLFFKQTIEGGLLSKEKDRLHFSVNVDSPRICGSDALSDSLLL